MEVKDAKKRGREEKRMKGRRGEGEGKRRDEGKR